MITSLTSTDLDPALSPLEPPPIQASLAMGPGTLPDDKQRQLIATFDGAPDAIVAGFKEELAEMRAGRA